MEHGATGSPISHKNVKCNSLGLALALDQPSSRGDFVHYNFLILHYISHNVSYVISKSQYDSCRLYMHYICQ